MHVAFHPDNTPSGMTMSVLHMRPKFTELVVESGIQSWGVSFPSLDLNWHRDRFGGGSREASSMLRELAGGFLGVHRTAPVCACMCVVCVCVYKAWAAFLPYLGVPHLSHADMTLS